VAVQIREEDGAAASATACAADNGLVEMQQKNEKNEKEEQ
jgi:hypothetical protein